jgi:LacI family transcriptional regulator
MNSDQRGTRPTIEDIAALAGVSKSTVGRVLADAGYSSPAARDRVLAAAKELKYVTNSLARGLRASSSGVMGVLISDLGNQFYSDLGTGIEEELRAHGYGMVLANSGGDPLNERTSLLQLESLRVEAIILTPSSVDSTTIQAIVSRGMVVTEIDRQTAPKHCDAVLLQNERAAFDATEHLLALGHKRIAILLGELTYTTGRERLAGYTKALRARGISLDERLVHHDSFHPSDPHQTGLKVLSSRPRPTAVFAANSLLAESVIAAAMAEQVSIPEELSVVGLDDAIWMRLTTPPITTVAQPTSEMGHEAAGLAIARVRGELAGAPVVRRLDHRLVLRSSTAPPQAARNRRPANRKDSIKVD